MSTVTPFRGVPSFFRAACREASQQLHRLSYADAGYSLASALPNLVPYEVEEDRWAVILDEFEAMIDQRSNEECMEWLHKWLPGCLALVPRRKQDAFLASVRRFYLESWGRA